MSKTSKWSYCSTDFNHVTDMTPTVTFDLKEVKNVKCIKMKLLLHWLQPCYWHYHNCDLWPQRGQTNQIGGIASLILTMLLAVTTTVSFDSKTLIFWPFKGQIWQMNGIAHSGQNILTILVLQGVLWLKFLKTNCPMVISVLNATNHIIFSSF